MIIQQTNSNLAIVSIKERRLCAAGIGGSGRQSASKLATFIAEYELFEIEITKNYTTVEWREDLRRMLRRAGEENVPTVFLFADHQIKVKG